MAEIILTSDGSHTLFVPEINEHYHSVHGAVQESLTVYIKNGYEFSRAEKISVLEIGFGTGLNVLLTLAGAIKDQRMVDFTTIEKYPLERKITAKLNHYKFAGIKGGELFSAIHEAPWDKKVSINRWFSLTKIKADFISCDIKGSFNLIYYDAFAPGKQPEMWQESLFRKIESVTQPGGVFVTYSSKGTLQRLLKLCGFNVELIPGPPGKREILRAVKI